MTVPPPLMIVIAQGASSTGQRLRLVSEWRTVTWVPVGSRSTAISFWMPTRGSTAWRSRRVLPLSSRSTGALSGE
ncbi:MAG: hypothetical protein DMF81_20435 [Acidobacteria bacterium]|nr:MAG: hypothetical protein DMF81_20435 [Acidobacteriota bacterium]